MTATERASGRPSDRKAVLHCSVCGYEAPVEGEWSVDRREGVDSGRTDIQCPDCTELVVSQPTFDSNDRGPTPNPVRPLLQLVNSVVRHDVL